MTVQTKSIPFVQPDLADADIEAVVAALRAGHIGGNGVVSRRVQARLRDLTGARHALLTTSCSHALELAMMALNIGPGDEVILPSFAFVTAATAVIRQGARPVFAEIDEATFNLDPDDVARRITPRTRAIIPVHYAGQGCRMHDLLELAHRHNLLLIEDAAQAIGASYGGRALGTLGHIGCFSFHVTKNLIAGEGGAFLTNDDDIARRAEIIREKGTNRTAFLRGEVDKYTWVDIGSSFIPSDLLAALLESQLNRLEEITQHRLALWHRYYHGMAGMEADGLLIRPGLDPLAQINGHIYAFRVAPEKRDAVIGALKARGIGATFHFVPLHSSPYGRNVLGCNPGDLPVTERVAASLIRLPLHAGMGAPEVDFILEQLEQILTS
ncbi:MAG: dTDP-4-amino-4,6-dideoxygalactose transaminase [Caldilineae bacterium]|nr:MAG: dTDP-4-amino-4,6-dideoxygalactose transaminase [Caldilineae bacterium]